MPLDINIFRREPDVVRESQRRRFEPVEIVDEVSSCACTIRGSGRAWLWLHERLAMCTCASAGVVVGSYLKHQQQASLFDFFVSIRDRERESVRMVCVVVLLRCCSHTSTTGES